MRNVMGIILNGKTSESLVYPLPVEDLMPLSAWLFFGNQLREVAGRKADNNDRHTD